MKKLIAVAAILVAGVFTANAQNTKMWIGGAASFQSSKVDVDGADPVTMGEFSPAFGYNLNENLTVGLALNIAGGKSTDDGLEVKTSRFGVSPFVRYGRSAGEKLTLFGQANIGFGSEKAKVDGTSNDGVSFFNVGVSPGLDYAFSEAWSITVLVGALSYESQNDKDFDVKTNTFNFGLDLNALQFGLYYHFGQ